MNHKTLLVSIFLLLNYLNITAHYLIITNHSGFTIWGGFNVDGDLSEYEYDKEKILVIRSMNREFIKLPLSLKDDDTFQLNFLYPCTDVTESSHFLTYRIGDIKNKNIIIGNKDDSGSTEEDLTIALESVSKRLLQRLAHLHPASSTP